MVALGSSAPWFSLPDVVSGELVNQGKPGDSTGTVIMFICNHCPYVKHVNHEITCMAHEYIKKNIRFIAINSNDTERYPDDSPEKMQQTARVEAYPFPYLFDETQEVAKAYQAVCTPDFFVYNSNLELVYRGQLDDSRPGNQYPVTGYSLRNALDCLISNQPVSATQYPSLGCNIKWK